MLDGAVVSAYRPSQFGVILTQYSHHFLRVCGFRKCCKSAQVNVYDSDFRTAGFERIVSLSGHNQFADLWRQEASKLGHATKLGHLLGDPRLQRSVPLRELRCLFLDLAAFCLKFAKHPRVFNCDYGLVREGFDKRNLCIGERCDFLSIHRYDADRNPLSEDWHDNEGTITKDFLKLRVGVIGFGEDVVDVDHPPLKHRTTHEGLFIWPQGKGSLEETATFYIRNVVCSEAQDFAIVAQDVSEHCPAQLNSPFDDQIKNRLGVSRRLSDHLQDFAGGLLKRQRFGAPRFTDFQLFSKACNRMAGFYTFGNSHCGPAPSQWRPQLRTTDSS